MEIENDINEEHNVHDGVNDQQLHRFFYNCFFKILNVMRGPVMSVILIIKIFPSGGSSQTTTSASGGKGWPYFCWFSHEMLKVEEVEEEVLAARLSTAP